MEIRMKSLSGQGRKSPTALFIITERFYGGQPLCWDVLGRNAQQRTCWVMTPLLLQGGGLHVPGYICNSIKHRTYDSEMM